MAYGYQTFSHVFQKRVLSKRKTTGGLQPTRSYNRNQYYAHLSTSRNSPKHRCGKELRQKSQLRGDGRESERSRRSEKSREREFWIIFARNSVRGILFRTIILTNSATYRKKEHPLSHRPIHEPSNVYMRNCMRVQQDPRDDCYEALRKKAD